MRRKGNDEGYEISRRKIRRRGGDRRVEERNREERRQNGRTGVKKKKDVCNGENKSKEINSF